MTVGAHHPHSSLVARDLAERGTVLRVQVGSGVHGTSIVGQDDRDEMGLCLEPRGYVTGVSQVPSRDNAEPATSRSSSTSTTRRGSARAGWRIAPVRATWTSPS